MKIYAYVAAAGFVMAGCAGESETSSAPAAEDQGLGERTVTVDGWTATAYPPWTTCIGPGPDGCAWSDLTAQADFAGPSGTTRRAGVCLLQMTDTSCNTVADCGGSPSTLPSGGFRYCANVSGYKRCGFRPGSPQNFCAGTPAMGGASVPPGFYSAPRRTVPDYTDHVSYACFAGCATSDPSVSSATTNVAPGTRCFDDYGVEIACNH